MSTQQYLLRLRSICLDNHIDHTSLQADKCQSPKPQSLISRRLINVEPLVTDKNINNSALIKKYGRHQDICLNVQQFKKTLTNDIKSKQTKSYEIQEKNIAAKPKKRSKTEKTLKDNNNNLKILKSLR